MPATHSTAVGEYCSGMRSTLTAGAIAFLLASCTTSGSPSSSLPTEKDWLLVAHGPPATMAALLTGTLEIDLSSQCVRVRNGEQAIAVIFVEETVLDDSDPEHPAIAFNNGSRFEAGEQVIFGGGSRPVTDIVDSSQGSYSGVSIPPDCHDGQVWLLSEAP